MESAANWENLRAIALQLMVHGGHKKALFEYSSGDTRFPYLFWKNAIRNNMKYSIFTSNPR